MILPCVLPPQNLLPHFFRLVRVSCLFPLCFLCVSSVFHMCFLSLSLSLSLSLFVDFLL